MWSAVLTLSLAVGQCVLAQVTPVHPLRVIDLKEITQRDLGKIGSRIEKIAQGSGRWAALIQGPGDQSIVVSGDALSERSFALNGVFDRILIDQDTHFHLRQAKPWRPRSAAREVRIQEPTATVLDSEGREIETLDLPTRDLEPFVAAGRVQWSIHPRSSRVDAQEVEEVGWLGSGASWFLARFSE